MQPARATRPSAFSFTDISLEQIGTLGSSELDQLPFGVIGLDAAGEVRKFNATEGRMAGLNPKEVLGSRFFTEYGRCMDNQRVAGRFEKESDLDVILDHVLTFRMKITPAKLRLLAGCGSKLKYLLVQR